MEFPKRMLFLLLFLRFAKFIEGKTKFQKMLFLAKAEYGLEHGYDFTRYIYGPYSQTLSSDLMSLISLELVKIDEVIFNTPGPFEGKLATISLTKKGEELIDSKLDDFSVEEKDKIKKVVMDWNPKNFKEILSYVYKKYLP